MKTWVNPWTEVEELGRDAQGRMKFGATISAGRQVFKDKSDGQWKRRKLTDSRPGPVVLQGPGCCVEVYPYYAKYFDVDHEEVRVEEERWVVQRWRDPPGTWRDVGAWNPVMEVEETEDTVKVTVTYETDYGPFVLEYIQRDGSTLKHNVTFTNESGGAETFRVLQRWAGIAGDRVKWHGKTRNITKQEVMVGYDFKFQDGEKTVINENQAAMCPFNPDDVLKSLLWKIEGSCRNECGKCCEIWYQGELGFCPHYDAAEPDKCRIHVDKLEQYWRQDETYGEWLVRRNPECPNCFRPMEEFLPRVTPECGFKLVYEELGPDSRTDMIKLQPVVVDVHAAGMKADFIFERWTLGQDEGLEIDPASSTLSDPEDDAYIRFVDPNYTRFTAAVLVDFSYDNTKGSNILTRGYVEWDISSIPDVSTITKVEFRYHGLVHVDNSDIRAMAAQPSVGANVAVFGDIADGTAYLNNDAVFPENGTGKDVGGAAGPAWDTSPVADVQAALAGDWFAFGFKSTTEAHSGASSNSFYTEDKVGPAADPPPTLYLEYHGPPVASVSVPPLKTLIMAEVI